MALKISKELLLEAVEIQKDIFQTQDLDHQLPRTIGNITKLLAADRTTLFLIDEEEMLLHAKVAEGLDNEQISIRMNMGIVGAAVLTNKCINQSKATDYRHFEESYDELTGYSTESVIAVPIRNQNEEVIGAIELLNHRDGQFSKSNEERIIEWARTLGPLLSDSEKTGDEIKAVIEDHVDRFNADRGTLFKLDPYTSHLISIYGTGLEDMPIILDLGLGAVGNVAVTGKPLIINDVQSDPRFDKTIDNNTGYKTDNLIAVPLLDSHDNLIGIFEVINKREGEDFNDQDITLLTLVARVMAISMENVNLLKRTSPRT